MTGQEANLSFSRKRESMAAARVRILAFAGMIGQSSNARAAKAAYDFPGRGLGT
jgi:hypothetical protein